MSEADAAPPGSADRPIAFKHRPGRGPTLIFLPGYMSDMEGTKALALDAWAAREGRAMLRFDYGGVGASGGDFEAQALADWRDDALAMVDQVAEGPVVLVGSSMGGWLMLHLALARPDRVVGLVGIAAAPDYTGWGFTQEEKMTILREGRIVHGDRVTSRAFWESGESLRLLHAPIDIAVPVRLLHGQQDETVPWAYAIEIARQLRSADVQTILIKDGDHRLSREQDIATLIATLESLLEAL